MRVYQSRGPHPGQAVARRRRDARARAEQGLPAWAWITGGVVLTGGLAAGGYFMFKQDPKYDGPTGNLSPGVVQANAPIRFR